MSAAAATADHAKDPAPRDAERGRLLGLVRKLIDYGREMVATLQARGTETPPVAFAWRFGTLDLALIINRITRGLMIAGVLEKRLLHPRPRPPSTEPVQSPAPRPPRAPRRPPVDEDAELKTGLPSAREIAARLRNRKTGAVIVEICRDLGIACDHPLWREINKAIMFNGGRLANMIRIWMRRAADCALLPMEIMLQELPWEQKPLATGTGPP